MASYGYPGPQNPPQQQQSYNAQNLQFYPSTYGNQVSGHSTPQQAGYGAGGYGAQGGAQSYPSYGGGAQGFMSTSPGFGQGVSGRMGEQGGLRTGWLAAFSAEGYESEPPLLEELGVNFGHIKVKTLTVLNPFAHIDQHLYDDSDLFGPIIFFLAFGTFLLLSGKVHFGYIYGLGLIGSVSLHWIFSLMSNPQLDSASNMGPSYDTNMNMGGYGAPMGNMGSMSGGGGGHDPSDNISTLTFFRSCSVLGYCLLPLVLTSFVGVAVNMDTAAGYLITSLAVAWCTYSSSGMFAAVGRMHKMRPLVAYPLVLFYVGFGIMGIFSSRGSGQLAARANL